MKKVLLFLTLVCTVLFASNINKGLVELKLSEDPKYYVKDLDNSLKKDKEVVSTTKETYKIYENANNDIYAKVDGINTLIKLFTGAGIPHILSLDSTKNKDIKLLKCFAGDLGTSVLVGYYYTYILDFKKKKIVGFVEYYDDYGHYSKIDKKPKWMFQKDQVEVLIYDIEKENYKNLLFSLK